MTTLRTAAQQALKALEGGADSWQRVGPAIDALRAALTEDAMQKFTDVNQELQAALGCDHCNHPMYAAIKCRVCGRVTKPAPPQRKPLTDEEISNIWDGHIVPIFGKNGINPVVFAREIERAHNITGDNT